MNDVTAAVESASHSIQSSIIKPRFRDGDTLFSTINIYEDDEVFQNLTSSVKYAVPGTNTVLLSQSDYFTGLFYTLLRRILSIYFTIYQYGLWITSQFFEIYTFIISYTWYLLTFLPLPEDVSTVGPAATFSSSTINLNKSSDSSINNSITETIYSYYNQLSLLPTRLGNIILERSVSSFVPRSRMKIRQATGRLYIPDHITFIFEMSPLVVQRPPEVPTPYLDYEKKIVIPEKKEVAKVLAKRAEWISMHHTHKAAESFRVLYEAAKCITWASCSGVRIITVFESNGYSWKDMQKVSNIIKEEMKNLTKDSYQISDNIRIISLSTLEKIDVFNNEVEDGFENNDKDIISHHGDEEVEENDSNEIIHLNPEPESIVSQNLEVEKDDLNDKIHTFRTNTTVFFMSNKETNVNTFRALKIKQQLSIELNNPNILTNTIESEMEAMHYPIFPGYVDNYTDPELIIKFCTQHQMPYSLSGYPLFSNSTVGPVFISQSKPANFPQFINGLHEINKVVKQS